MYRYDTYDQKIVDERVAQFREQTRRYLAGELTDDEFRPLRLQNGLWACAPDGTSATPGTSTALGSAT